MAPKKKNTITSPSKTNGTICLDNTIQHLDQLRDHFLSKLADTCLELAKEEKLVKLFQASQPIKPTAAPYEMSLEANIQRHAGEAEKLKTQITALNQDWSVLREGVLAKFRKVFPGVEVVPTTEQGENEGEE